MTSTRFPGKVMQPLLGIPMIGRQIERLQRAQGIDSLVVATSTDPSDDMLAEYVSSLGVPVVRGPLDDVLARFVMAVDVHLPTTVVRLTADCPLTSPVVIDEVIATFHEQGVDYCSNTLTPTYPDGLDVEVTTPQALIEVADMSVDPAEHEHVTLGIYRRPDRYRVLNVAGSIDLSSLRWTVDTPEDFAFVEKVYEALYAVDPAFELNDVLSLLEREPRLSRTTADEVRNAALVGLDTGAMHA